MVNDDLQAPETICWPQELEAQSFLDEYWQKKPLLLRQAFPNFKTPITPDELAGLSLEEDTSPRLITQDRSGNYHLEHGPFKEKKFSKLKGNDWSLLVTDIEKHCPELVAFLKPFQFIPDWRIDDIMISYAPEGASVGAHVDEYDVFLLQASGTRQWRIDSTANPDLSVAPDSTMKVLENFNANEHHELVPGDMLYLPPGVPHHGIASSENCTTWSIGFRAPVMADVVMAFAELLSEKLDTRRYTDPSLKVATPGRIDPQSLQAFAALWRETVNVSDEELAMLTAKVLTTPSVEVGRDEFEPPQVRNGQWQKHPFSRFGYVENNHEQVTLFTDGQHTTCSLTLAKALCNNQSVSINDLSASDADVLEKLMVDGCLYQIEDND